MARRGRKRDRTREIRYWELLSQGIGTIEACRLVGVSRKTGYRWRAEMGGTSVRNHPELILRGPRGRHPANTHATPPIRFCSDDLNAPLLAQAVTGTLCKIPASTTSDRPRV